MSSNERKRQQVAEIIRLAGGELIGQTRLQKIAYILTVAGLEDEFSFEYKHYGPYSEGLAEASNLAKIFGLIQEEEYLASWGGAYSVFKAAGLADEASIKARFIEKMKTANAVDLEIAATAVFFALDQHDDPWEETRKLKPSKTSTERVERSKFLLKQLEDLMPKNIFGSLSLA